MNKKFNDYYQAYSKEKSAYVNMKERYRTKISLLENKKQMLEMKTRMGSAFSFIPKVSDSTDKSVDEIEKIDANIAKLKEERNKKVSEKKREVESAKSELKEYVKGLKTMQFTKKHIKAIGATVFLLISIPIFSLTTKNIQNKIEIEREEKRDYYINTSEEEYIFECNIDESKIEDNYYSSIPCQEREISGKFSEYETVELQDVSAEGNMFREKINKSISSYEYIKSNFDVEKIDEDLSVTKTFVLYNRRLQKTVASKTITAKYVLTDNDKKIIENRHKQYLKYEEEQKAKREKEEAERKAKEAEEENRRLASECTSKTNSIYKYTWDSKSKKCIEKKKNASTQKNTNTTKKNTNTNTKKTQKTGITGYCKDGYPATGNPSAPGKANSCYGHGGWQR